MNGASRERVFLASTTAFVALVPVVYLIASLEAGSRGRGYAALTIAESVLMFVAMASAGDASDRRRLLGAGIVVRLALFFAPAFTSNDAGRYLWDGAAAIAGFDPYFYSPRGIAAHLPQWTLPADNAGYVTLYPPAALGTFAVAASFGPMLGPWVWKAIVTAASIATLFVTDRALVRCRAGAGSLALVALSPLLIFESGVGAHVDTLAALSVALGARAWLDDRADHASAYFALGGLFKLAPALVLIPLFFAASARVRPRMLAWGSAVFLGGYGVVISLGMRPFGSLGAFLSEWRFGSPLFFVLEGALGTERARVAAGVVLLASIAASIVVARMIDPLRGALIALVSPFLASPVVFPWYLASQAPLVAIRRSYAWLFASIAFPTTYEVLDRFDRGGEFQQGLVPLGLIALGVAVGLAFDLRRPDAAPLESFE